MKIFKFCDVVPQVPNIVFRHRFRYTFELLPYEAQGFSLRKIKKLFRGRDEPVYVAVKTSGISCHSPGGTNQFLQSLLSPVPYYLANTL